MSKGWKAVPLGELLVRSNEAIEIVPAEQYKEVTIRLWGKGVVLRGEIQGQEITATRRFGVKAGQFILSRIDARNGAFGVVPDLLDGAVASNDFPAYNIDESKMLTAYLGWISKTQHFVDFCRAASEGTTNRVRLKEERFLATSIPLPPLSEQRRIVAKVEELAAKVEEAKRMRAAVSSTSNALLRSVFANLITEASWESMNTVAPLVRRPVSVLPDGAYPELGVRSFGKGTFHKPSLSGLEVGTKKLYHIEPGDLLFNNVFAWEGAIAVALPADTGRVGSHRFITCKANPERATATFLRFYFLTEDGLAKIGRASPGGAGRNRTLGLEALSEICVPVIPLARQKWFDRLQESVGGVLAQQEESQAELDALLPSILDKAFKGEL